MTKNQLKALYGQLAVVVPNVPRLETSRVKKEELAEKIFSVKGIRPNHIAKLWGQSPANVRNILRTQGGYHHRMNGPWKLSGKDYVSLLSQRTEVRLFDSDIKDNHASH